MKRWLREQRMSDNTNCTAAALEVKGLCEQQMCANTDCTAAALETKIQFEERKLDLDGARTLGCMEGSALPLSPQGKCGHQTGPRSPDRGVDVEKKKQCGTRIPATSKLVNNSTKKSNLSAAGNVGVANHPSPKPRKESKESTEDRRRRAV